MTRLRPASWPWLLRHELRLAWRGAGSGKARRRRFPRLAVVPVLGAVLWAAYHALLWFGLRLLHVDSIAPRVLVLVGAVTVFVFTLMLSQSIVQSVEALYDRGDFDLLLSSPIEPWKVFAVRALGIAVSVASFYLLLLAPAAHVGPFTGNPGLLGLYPGIAALALLATAAGIALTLGLVRWLGTRRARVVAQLIGAFVGALVFVGAQAQNLFRDTDLAARAMAAFRAAASSTWFDAESPLWWPAQAMLGRPLAMAVVLAAGLGAFALVVRATGRTFLEGTQTATEAVAPAGSVMSTARAGERVVPHRFRTGLAGLVLRKEWKLVRRDPQLIAQTLLQTLYLLPLVFVAPRSQGLVSVVVPAIVIAASTLVSSLAWLAVAAEDAPELIAAAPVDASRVRRLKLLAALLPVWAMCMPALAFAAHDARHAAVFVFCVLGATASAGWIQIVAAKPGERRQLRKRGKGNGLVTAIEMASGAGWAATAWCLAAAPLFAPLPLIAALGAPGVATLVGRRRRRDEA